MWQFCELIVWDTEKTEENNYLGEHQIRYLQNDISIRLTAKLQSCLEKKLTLRETATIIIFNEWNIKMEKAYIYNARPRNKKHSCKSHESHWHLTVIVRQTHRQAETQRRNADRLTQNRPRFARSTNSCWLVPLTNKRTLQNLYLSRC